MSTVCPLGQNADGERTEFGSCLDAIRTLDPTRPVPSRHRPEVGEGLYKPTNVDSPSPSVLSQVWHQLTAGLRVLSDNDHGRPWPNPDRAVLRRLLAEHDSDLCIQAAKDAREIVQSQDRAPNVTGLFEKKLADLAEVRAAVRGALDDVAIVGEEEPCL
jgi:hypothetical protein